METTQLSIRAGQETGDTLVQPTLIDPTITIATGQKSYLDSIEGQRFRVSSPSFFQVNVEQAAQVADTLLQNLDLKSTDLVLDAYTGVGTFAVLLAPHVKKVIAVEESSAAVADARENLGGLENVELVLGKTEEILPNLKERPDVVILDPPRAGCHPRTLQSLLSLASPKIAYVSCDPETLARDLKILCEDIYVLDQVIPLDMFPQTHHVECVALLSRNEPAQPLFLASASPRRRRGP
ncbi:MAG: 23S rRNA (uracil(1939)-C(5))-methyltransferase RlmD [Proteobacteria bacterium]|nr:23S rRNA (uracil(1939)-C(5))-methyltransferase RlmD [Pseudomonadota bacterium]